MVVTFWDDQGQILPIAEEHNLLPIKLCEKFFNHYVEKKGAETASLLGAQGVKLWDGEMALKSHASSKLRQNPSSNYQKATPDFFLH